MDGDHTLARCEEVILATQRLNAMCATNEHAP